MIELTDSVIKVYLAVTLWYKGINFDLFFGKKMSKLS